MRGRLRSSRDIFSLCRNLVSCSVLSPSTWYLHSPQTKVRDLITVGLLLGTKLIAFAEVGGSVLPLNGISDRSGTQSDIYSKYFGLDLDMDHLPSYNLQSRRLSKTSPSLLASSCAKSSI